MQLFYFCFILFCCLPYLSGMVAKCVIFFLIKNDFLDSRRTGHRHYAGNRGPLSQKVSIQALSYTLSFLPCIKTLGKVNLSEEKHAFVK